jgi:hypothetical protein
MSSPNPPGAHHITALSSVACPENTTCYAVGSDMVPGIATATVIERWDGTGWSMMRADSVPAGGLLIGVACSSAIQCDAVGYRTVRSNPYQTLVERWDGSRWSVMASPSRNGITTWGMLVAVACTSSTNCHAVGIGSPGDPFAEHWNGKQWVIAPA